MLGCEVSRAIDQYQVPVVVAIAALGPVGGEVVDIDAYRHATLTWPTGGAIDEAPGAPETLL